MYILVEILHTEFQYISLIEIKSIIEIEKQLKKRNRKECYQPGQKGAFCPGCQTRDKRAPLLSRPGVLCWETDTTEVSQPRQISVSVVVDPSPRCTLSPSGRVRTQRIYWTFVLFCFDVYLQEMILGVAPESQRAIYALDPAFLCQIVDELPCMAQSLH